MTSEGGQMGDFKLTHHELSQYGSLKLKLIELDENIREVEDELAEINRYNINISSVITGMPKGNEVRDKIGDFVIKLDRDRLRLCTQLIGMVDERSAIKHKLHLIRLAVNVIQDEKLRNIIIWHYFDGESISDIANKTFISIDGVRKKINRCLKISDDD